MTKESQESPIVSFRVPLGVIERLQQAGKLKPGYTKSELSNLIKSEWLAIAGEEVPITVDARSVDAVNDKVDAVYSKLDEVLQLLRGKQQTV
jgi:hypothetical protein